MALCDYLLNSDIAGVDCNSLPSVGVNAVGVLINRKDINFEYVTGLVTDEHPFRVSFTNPRAFKCRKHGYTVTQVGRKPFDGTQQEMVEGTHQNTITNTLQFVILRHDANFAGDAFALMNGDFVAILYNKNGTYQVYGLETGLRCTGAIRELYNDDTLAGWQFTMQEVGAAKGNFFTDFASWAAALNELGGMCDPVAPV